jgi:hypothetical protein
MGLIAIFHGLDGRSTVQRRLGQLVVVQVYITHQSLRHIFAADEVVGLKDVGNPAIEALVLPLVPLRHPCRKPLRGLDLEYHHTVGFGVLGFGQAMFDV